ncbi:MAG TPA: hypothetical protein VGC54_05380 [Planctomycetota bacterium]
MQLRALPLLVLAGAFFALPLAAQEPDEPGPYLVGWRDVGFVDQNYGRGALVGRVYYPATAAGLDQPADPAHGPYPMVGFMHGSGARPDRYDDIQVHLASWGFVVPAIDFNGLSMPGIARDERSILQWTEDRSNDPVSWLAGMVRAGDWGAFGHSMGGGGCPYLLKFEPRVRTLMPMEPYRGVTAGGFANSQAALQAFTGNLHFVAGSIDLVCNWDTQVLLYSQDALSARRNLFTRIEGASHFGPSDTPPLNDPIPGPEQHRMHRRLVGVFFRAEMLGQENLYGESFGEGARTEPFEHLVKSQEPPFWAARSEVDGSRIAVGLLGNPGDTRAFGWSLAPASIQTQWGLLGLDLGQGDGFGYGTGGARGRALATLPVRAAWSGRTLYLQGGSVPGGGLTRVIALAIP